MNKALSERRMAENEVIFRDINEQVQRGFEEIKRIAKEDGQETHIKDLDEPLHFYCECSDENCQKRIMMKPSRYNKIHENRNRFVIACGHEVKSIEHILDKEEDYCIIEKYEVPPTVEGSKLNATEADNS